MNVSKINENLFFNTNVIQVDKPTLSQLKKIGLDKRVFSKEVIDNGSLIDNNNKNVFNGYLTEFENGLTNGQCLASRAGLEGLNLEDMYKYALEQYEKINNSSDDNETKDLKRVALETALKSITDKFAFTKTWSNYKIDVFNVEKDKNVMSDMKKFQYNQFNAITNSMRKLTLKFLNYVKNTDDFNFDSILAFLNENTKNRDINNLGLNELSDYFMYVEKSGFMHTQSNSDADFYNGYFNVVAKGIANDDITDRWEGSVFNPLLKHKFTGFSVKIWKRIFVITPLFKLI